MQAAGNLNLCAGLPAGIEGAVHSILERWGDAGDTDMEDPSACLLVDARNAFNELGRKAMLWTVRHRWPQGSRFAFNCYCHSAQLVI